MIVYTGSSVLTWIGELVRERSKAHVNALRHNKDVLEAGDLQYSAVQPIDCALTVNQPYPQPRMMNTHSGACRCGGAELAVRVGPEASKHAHEGGLARGISSRNH
jgi:hypothetical protein